MLKIMLADADAENIKNFKKYIRTAFPDNRVVGSAAKAKDFAAQVKEMEPNLIIADIQFFGSLALQKLRDIYEFFPEVRFILYGTFSDAEIMERVREYGVIDTIFRPVKPQELEKCIKHAGKVFLEKERIAKEREILVSKFHSNIDMFKDRFLMNLTRGHLTSEDEINASLKYFNIRLTPGYCVFTVRIDNFQKIILTLEEMEKYLLVYKILLIINEGLARLGEGCAVVNRLNTVSVVLGGNISLIEAIKFCDRLRADIGHQTKIGVTIGLGRVYSDLADIAVSYRESESALRYRHYMGYNTVIPIHFAEPLNNTTYRYPIEKEIRLVYSAVAGEYEHCKRLLGQIFAALEKSSPLPDKLIPKIVMDILVRINRFASEQRLDTSDKFTAIFPSKEALALKTLDDAHVFLNLALKEFCKYIYDVKEEKNRKLLEKAKEYVEENFDGNLPLVYVAAHVGTTPEFLGDLFKKTYGYSLYQHTINTRVSKAAELLKEGASVRDAAIAVGYGDSAHFRAVFKQSMGVTAEEYIRASK